MIKKFHRVQKILNMLKTIVRGKKKFELADGIGTAQAIGKNNLKLQNSLIAPSELLGSLM